MAKPMAMIANDKEMQNNRLAFDQSLYLQLRETLLNIRVAHCLNLSGAVLDEEIAKTHHRHSLPILF